MSPVAAFAVASAPASTASSPCTGALPSGPALRKDSVLTAEDARSIGAPPPDCGASEGLTLSESSLTGARREEALVLLRAVAAFRTAPHAAPCGAAHLLQPRKILDLTSKKDTDKEMGKTLRRAHGEPTRCRRKCARATRESHAQTQTQHYRNTA